MTTPISFKAFRDKYLGKGYNFDGVYGLQCVDGFKIAMFELGGPTGAIGGDGWADNIWYNRNRYSNVCNFITDMSKLQDGDIVIWAHKMRKTNTPLKSSHVAFYYKGKMFGMNQASNRYFTEKVVDESVWLGAIGALRPKAWNKVVDTDGFPYPEYTDQQLAYDILYDNKLHIGNGPDRKKNLGSRYVAVQAVVNNMLREYPTPNNIKELRVGDIVKVKRGKNITYEGKKFTLYYDKYQIMHITNKGKRVVIGVNGVITAAVRPEYLIRY